MLVITYVYNFYIEDKINLFNIDYISDIEFFSIFNLFLISIISFIIGVYLYFLLSKKKSLFLSKIQLTKQKKFSIKLLYLITSINMFVILILSFFIYEFNINLFLVRDFYFLEGHRMAKILIFFFMFIQIFLLAKIYTKNKIYSLILFAISILPYIATGSRKIALFIVVYFLTVKLFNPNFIKSKFKLLISAVFLLYIVLNIFNLRGNEIHGFIPYIQYMFIPNVDDLMMLQSNFLFLIYYLFVFGFYMVPQVMDMNIVNYSTTLTSINPLPGNVAGWYEISEQMRINIYAPFTLFGEVFSMGLSFIIFFFILIGVFFSYLDLTIRKLAIRDKKISIIIIYFFTIIFIIYAFQYNLRSSMRFIWYIFFFLLYLKTSSLFLKKGSVKK